ncbi:hypothetical protein CU102_26645 [Phyllobacterium brassicacearum]|uniref:Uncharacterized protein n=1 Tax=Phyllobacterium brassicacearum TaxID=314235 RepID=A0A2P7B5F1_9HYPH|nr:hypothetical protein [Phyllobacterium brassicacearum]PSH61695.1 hypothetical protein CU102_26645 [Phyllobacterium brassicacearum]TDQ14569.1 hypothetical protein DEV91_13812 [Phyllobacterium brassicacearum]
MGKRKRNPIPPIGVQPNIKPSGWDARLYQTSDLAMNAIEQERAQVREKTARLREERLKAEQAKIEKRSAAPTLGEIAKVVSRMKTSRVDQKKG